MYEHEERLTELRDEVAAEETSAAKDGRNVSGDRVAATRTVADDGLNREGSTKRGVQQKAGRVKSAYRQGDVGRRHRFSAHSSLHSPIRLEFGTQLS